MFPAALAIALLAAAMAQAAHAQGDGCGQGIADCLDRLAEHVERANRIATILYVVSFAVGAGLAGIAICATHGNARELREQAKRYEERTELLRGDIDEGRTPLMSWTQPGDGELTVGVAAGGVPIRVVNAGRAPALCVTGDVTCLLYRDGDATVVGEERYSWGAVLPDESVEMRVRVPEKALEAVAGGRAVFRADVLIEYESVGGRAYRLRVSAAYNRGRVDISDVDA